MPFVKMTVDNFFFCDKKHGQADEKTEKTGHFEEVIHTFSGKRIIINICDKMLFIYVDN